MADKIWPDTPFEKSMLDQGVIIHCPNEDLVCELFDILSENGVRWSRGESLRETYWRHNKTETCYRIRNHHMNYAGTIHYLEEDEYDDYIKCTFYGADTDESDISEEKFLALFDSGGE